MTTPQMDWLDDQRRKRAVSSDDIVQRLVPFFHDEQRMPAGLIRDVMDEIERLRAAGDALAEALHGWCNGMDAFTDDAERVRAWKAARRG